MISDATREWLAQHPMTREEALVYEGTICACIGSPLKGLREPCFCELRSMAKDVALGEEPKRWIWPT